MKACLHDSLRVKFQQGNCFNQTTLKFSETSVVHEGFNIYTLISRDNMLIELEYSRYIVVTVMSLYWNSY